MQLPPGQQPAARPGAAAAARGRRQTHWGAGLTGGQSGTGIRRAQGQEDELPEHPELGSLLVQLQLSCFEDFGGWKYSSVLNVTLITPEVGRQVRSIRWMHALIICVPLFTRCLYLPSCQTWTVLALMCHLLFGLRTTPSCSGWNIWIHRIDMCTGVICYYEAKNNPALDVDSPSAMKMPCKYIYIYFYLHI